MRDFFPKFWEKFQTVGVRGKGRGMFPFYFNWEKSDKKICVGAEVRVGESPVSSEGKRVEQFVKKSIFFLGFNFQMLCNFEIQPRSS